MTSDNNPYFPFKNQQQEAVGKKILETLHQFRRPVPGEGAVTTADYSLKFLEKIAHFIAQDKPIHLIMTAFPTKSASRLKALGEHPDMAEELCLKHLKSICDALKEVYPVGAYLTIQSDGGMFAEAFKPELTDKARIGYLQSLKEMIDDLGFSDTIKVRDSEGLAPYILEHYGESIESLEKRVHTNDELRSLYQAQSRFFTEEALGADPTLTKKQAKKHIRDRAYKVVQGSAAISKYLDHEEPDAIRLSCHPKGIGSDKLGIYLLPGGNKMTPWHGTAVLENHPNAYNFIKVEEAERLPVVLVNDNKGRPNRYEVPKDFNKVVVTGQQIIRKYLERKHSKASDQISILEKEDQSSSETEKKKKNKAKEKPISTKYLLDVFKKLTEEKLKDQTLRTGMRRFRM
jgi:L-tyrosine isonitrile synthase